MPTEARTPRAGPTAPALAFEPPFAQPRRVRLAIRWLPWLPVAVALAWLTRVLLRTLDWPLTDDGCMFHYVAWQVAQGAVPYRDVFDFQFPGTLFLHLGFVRLFGTGDAAWRMFDLAGLASACLLIARFHRRTSGWIAGASCALYVLWHLSLGAPNAGQRDFVMGVLLLGCAAAAAEALEGRARNRYLLLAGLAAGAAATIKPQAILFVLLAAAPIRGSARGGAGRDLALLAAGAALPPLAVTAWLASTGGLPAFVETVREYLVALHPQREFRSPARLAVEWLANPFVLTLVVLGLVSIARAARSGLATARRTLLLAGCAYGFVNLFVQTKGWSYHFEPAALFLCALAPTALEPSPRRQGALGKAAVGLCAALAVFAFLRLAPRAAARSGASDPTHGEIVAAAMADVRELAPRAERVQVWDSRIAGIEVLLRLGIRSATRFSDNTPLRIAPDSPAARRLRAEFLGDLRRRPPELLIVFGYDPASGRCADLEEFPEFAALVESDYRLLRDRGAFRVFAPRL
jgi:hypothetical protein